MSIGPRRQKPALLLVSHCVPSNEGGAKAEARRRAWQLVETFGRTHEVHLACLADGPVSLKQWRGLHARVKQIVIEPRSWVRRKIGSLIGALSPAGGWSIAAGRAFELPVREWSARFQFETIVHTNCRLLQSTEPLAQAERIADITQLSDITLAQAAGCDRAIVATAEGVGVAESMGLRPMLLPVRGATPALVYTGIEEADTIPLAVPLQKAA